MNNSSDTNNENHSLIIEYGEWLTTEQAAKYLGISPACLRNKVSAGTIQRIKFGRLNRYEFKYLKNLLHKSNSEKEEKWE